MILSDRLLKIAELVPKGSFTADIGTDHGFLPIHLYKHGITEKIIAADAAEKPLAKAITNIEKAGLTGKIKTLISDGLSNIERCETVIIAGMGGKEINRIITKDINKLRASTLILQPMTEVVKVRYHLAASGFEITDERLSQEGFWFYNIISAKPGENRYKTDFDFYIGRRLIDSQDGHLQAYLDKQAKKLTSLISSLEKTNKTKELIEAKYFLSEISKGQNKCQP